MGYLFRPKYAPEGQTYPEARKAGTLRESLIWWCQYSLHGKRIRESTGTEKETEARTFLKQKEGRVALGQPVLPKVDRIRYEEIALDLRRYYETTNRREKREYG